MHDVIVVGGGFAGVTAAREAAREGRTVLLVEARDRLGAEPGPLLGRAETSSTAAAGSLAQPFTWSEILRASLEVELSEDAEEAGWWVDGERREGTVGERDAIAERGWNRFVDGCQSYLRSRTTRHCRNPSWHASTR